MAAAAQDRSFFYVRAGAPEGAATQKEKDRIGFRLADAARSSNVRFYI
jgi:hypothetical protein